MNSYIEELKDVIRKLHGVESHPPQQRTSQRNL